jgi:hypothetical protein
VSVCLCVCVSVCLCVCVSVCLCVCVCLRVFIVYFLAALSLLLQIYSVLSDDRKRKVYDRSGSCEDDLGGIEGMDSQELYDYFR